MNFQTLHFETTDHMLRLSASGCTQRGTERDNNEDAIHISPNLEMLIVADGVGGHRAGELASKTAIREIIDQTDNWPIAGDDDLFQQLIDEALHRASRVIQELVEIDEEFWGAATTMTLAFRLDDHMFVANVGDSRAYRSRNGKLEQLTIDDSWVEILVRAGSITREQARSHPQRNLILTSLGGADFEEQKVEVGIMHLLPGDRVLISSDGLHDALSDQEIAQLAGCDDEVDVLTSRLVERAVAAGSRDDISVVLLDVSSVEPESSQSPGAFARAMAKVRSLLSRNRQPVSAES